MNEKILRAIEQNSKLTVEELAVMLGSTREQVAADIASMEEDKIICGYPTLINWEKISPEKLIALIEVKVTPQRGQGFDKIAERIYKFSEVETVFLMSGGFDLTVIIRGKSMSEVAGFVSDKLAPMEAVLSTSTHFVLKRYKENGIMMQQEKVDERIMVTP